MKRARKGKLLAACMCVAALTVAAVGGTFAYLTDTDSDVNVMTLGNVDIVQHEQQRGEDGKTLEPFEQGKDFYPGTEIDKIVTVENTGKSDAYFRTLIAVEDLPASKTFGVDFTIGEGYQWSADAEPVAAIELNGVTYQVYEVIYPGVLEVGKSSPASLTTVKLAATATNEDMAALGDTYEILVLSQAVQSAGWAEGTTAAQALDTAFGKVSDKAAEWFGGMEAPTAVATAEELADALNAGESVYLTEDIDLGATQINIPAGTEATLNLNGFDLSGDYAGADHYAMFAIPNGASLTVEGDGEVTASTQFADNNRSGAIFQNAGNLTLNGGVYSMSDSTEGKSWIISTIVDNRTNSAACETKLTINGGEYSVEGKAKNLFRNYPQQGGTATIVFNDGVFHANGGNTTYIWNQEAGSYLGELYFNGGTYDANVVYEDYNGQSDIHIAKDVAIQACADNN